MRKSLDSILIGIVGLLFTFLLPIIVLNVPLFKDLGRNDLFAYGLGFSVIIATGILLAFNVRFKNINDQERRIREELSEISLALSQEPGRLSHIVNREQLYITMVSFLAGAKQRIDLMYQAEKPPHSFRRLASKEKYLFQLKKKIDEGNVPIRRIILLTSENKPWIRDLVQEYNGKPSASLSLITTEIGFPIIGVQLFDDSKTVILNLGKDDTGIGPRDIVINSLEMNSIFEGHYNALYANCSPVIINGIVNQSNIDKYLS